MKNATVQKKKKGFSEGEKWNLISDTEEDRECTKCLCTYDLYVHGEL